MPTYHGEFVERRPAADVSVGFVDRPTVRLRHRDLAQVVGDGPGNPVLVAELSQIRVAKHGEANGVRLSGQAHIDLEGVSDWIGAQIGGINEVLGIAPALKLRGL